MKDLDKTYSDTWKKRIEMLGDIAYEEYLKSDHWKQVKRKALNRPNYQRCEFCGSTKVELHHTSYKWLGTKHELNVIIALCREHHQEVHDLARLSGKSVRVATYKLRRRYKKRNKKRICASIPLNNETLMKR